MKQRNIPYTIEEVRNIIKSVPDYELAEDEEFIYKNNAQKLKIKHISKDHIFEMSLDSFKNAGSRCNICVHNNR